ncbi:hypothetical protein F5Y04DRAFT_277691 [Hypomontagnella monticulosa]|nr:hypothetical protein F5Y04DRAFT_277691 [Hypomontagnella monticulosa]
MPRRRTGPQRGFKRYKDLHRVRPPVHIPRLTNLMYDDFYSGLKWTTHQEQCFDHQTECSVKKNRLLLRNPHESHIAKATFRGLGTKKTAIVDFAFADVYDFATEHVDLCASLEPVDFFARAKDSFAWSRDFKDQAFWAFTYKAFHARNLFLDHYIHLDSSSRVGMALAQALDNFRKAFDAKYPIDAAPSQLEKGGKTGQENVKGANSGPYTNEQLQKIYFPYNLTNANGQGDGTDKLIPIREERPIPQCIDDDFVPLFITPEMMEHKLDWLSTHRDAFEHPISKTQTDTSHTKRKKEMNTYRKTFEAHQEPRQDSDAQ